MSAAATRPATGGSSAAAVSAASVAAALAIVYVLWGSTYLAMRLAIATLPPFGMAAIRHTTAGVILYAFARARGAARPRLAQWRSTAIIGFLLLLVGNGGVVWAEQRVSSGMAALLICSEPMWIALMVWLLPGGRRPGWRVLGGLLLGTVGLVMLVRPASGGAAAHLALDPIGVIALLIAAIGWAAGSIYVQRANLPASPLLTTSMQMLCGGGLLFLASIFTGEPARFAVARVSTSSVLAVLYLIVFGSLVGFTCYTWLLRVASPVLVSTYAYVNPVVAVLLGWAFVDERVTGATLTGAAVILGAVALISTASARHARHSEPSQSGGLAGSEGDDRVAGTAGAEPLRAREVRAAGGTSMASGAPLTGVGAMGAIGATGAMGAMGATGAIGTTAVTVDRGMVETCASR